MVKVYTIGMIEHNAKSFPTVTSDKDVINGAFGKVADNKFSAFAAGEDMYVILNTQVGDDEYEDSYTIKAGEKLNAFRLADWEGQYLQISPANISGDVSAIAVGDTLTAGADFKLKKASATTGDIAFKVVEKINFVGTGLKVQIVVA